MNSLLYYYNNVQKMAAYRQAKRMQRGVKLGYVQVTGGSNTTGFIANSIPIGTEDFSIEFFGNSFGSGYYDLSIMMNKGVGIYDKRSFYVYNTNPDTNGLSWVLFEKPSSGALTDDSVSLNWRANEIEEKYLLAITRQGTTVKVYINGELKATKEQSAVKDLGDLQLAIANSSDVGFVRVWNMCLSADDVTDHYNNGDPMGYVVPKAMRGLEPIEITGENSYTWTGADSIANIGIRTNPNIKYGKYYVVNITVSNYEAGNPYLYIGYSYAIPNANGTYDIIIEHQNPSSNTILLFGGPAATDRRLTLTVNSITPVGLIAEYLPQNLIFGRDDKTIATSWLDSAKQLPLSDEYMEPLFQSVGGYDMAANGAPEILYNE